MGVEMTIARGKLQGVSQGGATAGHVKHREFANWGLENASSWQLMTKIDNKYPYNPDDPEETSFADFYVFERKQA